MKNKGITSVSLVITIAVLLILVAVSIRILENTVDENQIENIEQIKCKHDWVVTSKYDWMRECYKTISKCSICGKEVE